MDRRGTEVGAPHDPASASADPAGRARALAHQVGAQDVLVLRRLRGQEWFHVGGVGRSSGWAGAVVADDGEPHLAAASTSAAGVRLLAASPTPVVGPYWAATAVLLAMGPDLVVVWGHPGRSGALMAAADSTLRAASAQLLELVEAIDDPSPAGRLRDELAVLHAVATLTANLDQPVAATLDQLAQVLLGALDADLAAAWLGDGRRAVATGGGGARPGDDAALVAVAAAAAPRPHRGPRLGSGLLDPLPPPLSSADGIGSTLLLGLDVPGGAGILAARRPDAGGFTDLRQRIAGQLADTAATLLQVALGREEVERQLSDTRLLLGRDALTSAGSRHHWDAELEAAQLLVDSGVPVCVALLDLDDLKWVNDTHGHPAGDELLRVCADAVRGCLRGGSDVVARVGGDEFAVLVPRATDAAGLGERLRRGVEGARTSFGVGLRVSVGVVRCDPGGQVAAAFAEADALMYADKRDRRAVRGQRAPV